MQEEGQFREPAAASAGPFRESMSRTTSFGRVKEKLKREGIRVDLRRKLQSFVPAHDSRQALRRGSACLLRYRPLRPTPAVLPQRPRMSVKKWRGRSLGRVAMADDLLCWLLPGAWRWPAGSRPVRTIWRRLCGHGLDRHGAGERRA